MIQIHVLTAPVDALLIHLASHALVIFTVVSSAVRDHNTQSAITEAAADVREALAAAKSPSENCSSVAAQHERFAVAYYNAIPSGYNCFNNRNYYRRLNRCA